MKYIILSVKKSMILKFNKEVQKMYNPRIKMNKKIIKSPIYVFKKTWPMLIILTPKYDEIIKNNYKRL